MFSCKFCHSEYHPRTGAQLKQGQNPTAKAHKTRDCYYKHLHGGGGSQAFVVGGSQAFVVGGSQAFVVGGSQAIVGVSPAFVAFGGVPFFGGGVPAFGVATGVQSVGRSANHMAVVGGAGNVSQYRIIDGKLWDGTDLRTIVSTDLRTKRITYLPGDGAVAISIPIPKQS